MPVIDHLWRMGRRRFQDGFTTAARRLGVPVASLCIHCDSTAVMEAAYPGRPLDALGRTVER